MTKDDFDKIGLESNNNFGYNVIVVKNWEKFFPQISLPAEGPLVEFAQKYWFALMISHKHYAASFDIRVRGVDALYYRSRYSLDVVTTTKKEFFENYCPYNADDVRRYVWFNTLSKFDYVKICNEILDALTIIMYDYFEKSEKKE